MNLNRNGIPAGKTVRCAIYTRKSTEEGLEQEFNSLDAQREAAQAYIASQAQQGWLALPERYDDGGYSGGNLDRPALQRLLEDITAGKIDAVLTYKLDRLSRSLLDFARIMEIFDQHQVAFVSITQQFHSATSMGRLVLNMLLSFAQFERELIAERTRDKIAAARRKGKWVGGMPLLGYDIDPKGSKLRINETEATRVRAIFALYLESQALGPVLRELDRRGWRTKRWRTRKGRRRGGRAFTRNTLRQLLRNVTYLGQIRYRQEVHPGEHDALVDARTWQQVQTLLQARRHLQRPCLPSSALLQRLLRCGTCDCAMTSSQTTKGTRRYRYYVCRRAQQRGWRTCPAPALPAGPLEDLVVRQLPALAPAVAPEAILEVWQTLPPAEQARLLQRLVERVDYDAAQQTVSIAFRPEAGTALAEELARLAPETNP
jgi:site-specific DNA recombinase